MDCGEAPAATPKGDIGWTKPTLGVEGTPKTMFPPGWGVLANGEDGKATGMKPARWATGLWYGFLSKLSNSAFFAATIDASFCAWSTHEDHSLTKTSFKEWTVIDHMSMQTYNLMKGQSLFCTVICKCSQLFWTHIPTYVIWKATNDNSCLLVGMQLR